jgi:predicted Zn-dependent protease
MPGAAIIALVTTPFNQKKETACDMHGIDLAMSAGYSGCSCVSVWKRMSESVDITTYDPLDNLFRSHPYSAKREVCARNHIETNYSTNCN